MNHSENCCGDHSRHSELGCCSEGKEEEKRGWWKLTSTVDLQEDDLRHIAGLVEMGYREGEVIH